MKPSSNKHLFFFLAILLIALVVLLIYRPILRPLAPIPPIPAATPVSNETGITQMATIDSLLAGVYDGEMTLEELSRFGNFGIGTFHRLDGEMVLLDSMFYQIKADDNVYRPDRQTTTPFASVFFFPNTPLRSSLNEPMDEEALYRSIDRSAPNPNIPIAIRIDGHFSKVRTRSVPAQDKPYKPLAEVTKNQPEFDFDATEGTIVGFRLPAYVRGMNVPGYHLHFLTADRKRGGHLLQLRIESGTVALKPVHRFQVILPKNVPDFSEVDFSKDRSEELEKVEK